MEWLKNLSKEAKKIDMAACKSYYIDLFRQNREKGLPVNFAEQRARMKMLTLIHQKNIKNYEGVYILHKLAEEIDFNAI
jgi:hypothetical protein